MFKFTVRDLLWLTLVLAVGLGWLVRERQVQTDRVAREQQRIAEIDYARVQLNRWTRAAKAMEDVLKDDGWTVVWEYLGQEALFVAKLRKDGDGLQKYWFGLEYDIRPREVP